MQKKLKRKYDCLVPFSGGKDSSYVLYICKKIYKMKVLAVNFDNGFQTREATKNIKNAAERLDVDLMIYKPHWDLMKKLVNCFLLNAGEGCTPCNIGMNLLTQRIAYLEKIPLIMNGNSPRSDERSAKVIYTSELNYFHNVIKRHKLISEIKNTIYEDYKVKLTSYYKFRRKISKMAVMKRGIFKVLPNKYFVRQRTTIIVPEYLEWNENAIFNTIQSELEWEESKVGKEHTDCFFNPLKCYVRYERWGFGSKTQKLAALVRDGQMKREDALKFLGDEGNKPDEVKWIFERLGLDQSQLEIICNKDHLTYI